MALQPHVLLIPSHVSRMKSGRTDMGYQEKRRLIKVGKSNGVVLPKPWVDYHGNKAKVLTIFFGDDILIIAPKGYEAKARRALESTLCRG